MKRGFQITVGASTQMGHARTEQRFDSHEDVKKWLEEWFAAKEEDFY